MVRSFGVLEEGNLKLSITHEEAGSIIRTDCPELKQKLERAANSYPVHHSLHPEVVIDLNYSYTL